MPHRVKNWAAVKETRVPSLVRKIPWRRARQPTPVFLPGESHGQRSLVGYGVTRLRHDWATKQEHSPVCYLRAQARKGSVTVHLEAQKAKTNKQTTKKQLCVYLVPNNTGCMMTEALLGSGHSWAWGIISGLQAFVTRCSLMRNNLLFVWLFVLQNSAQMAAPLGKFLFCSVWFRSPDPQSDVHVGILLPKVMVVEGRDLGRCLGPEGGGLINGICCFM